MKSGQSRTNGKSLIVFATFAVIFLVGIFTYDHHDIFGDAPVERINGFITYEYINQFLFQREVPALSAMHLHRLEEWRDRQYGVLFQLPIIAIEDLKNFHISFRDAMLIRHLYCFVIYFVALLCFYGTLKELFASKMIALNGVLMEHLHYNLYAQSISNIKDGLFVSLYMIAGYFMIKLMKNRGSRKYIFLFSLFTALATSVRIYGFILIPTFLVYTLTEYFISCHSKNRDILNQLSSNITTFWKSNVFLLWVFLFFCVSYYVIMPVYWEHPWNAFKYTIDSALHFPGWDNTMEFMGKIGKWDEMPWYYLPVYMFLTIPLYTIFFFFIGVVLLIWNTCKKNIFENFVRYRFVWVYMGLFFILFLFQIIFHIKIYGRWRHMYILYPAFVVIATAGVYMLHNILASHAFVKKYKYATCIVPIVLLFGFSVSVARMIKDHPHEQAMYNIIGMHYGAENNRAGHGREEIYGYMLKNDQSPMLKVKFDPIGIVTLDAKASRRIKWVRSDYQYLLIDYRNIIGNNFLLQGYSEIHTIWQDGYKLASLYKKNP